MKDGETPLHVYIEALLFHKGGAMTIGELSRILEHPKDAILNALHKLKDDLSDRGLTLLKKGDAWMLGTDPRAAHVIERMVKRDMGKKLSKAALETLAIILYQGPISRAQIDYIRGVNSTFILRNLIMRGLIERVSHPSKQQTLYRPTFDTLAYLGVSSVEAMPDYNEFRREIAKRIHDAA